MKHDGSHSSTTQGAGQTHPIENHRETGKGEKQRSLALQQKNLAMTGRITRYDK